MTHPSVEKNVRTTVAELNALPLVEEVSALLRVEH